MAEKVLIVKYGEIAMRGNNKYIFINRLISAIRKNLRSEEHTSELQSRE